MIKYNRIGTCSAGGSPIKAACEEAKMAPPKLTEASIRAGATEKSFARGRELFREGAVSQTAVQGDMLSGLCEGTESPFYRVRAELDEGGVRTVSCTCPYDYGGYCKHVIALLLSYARDPTRF